MNLPTVAAIIIATCGVLIASMAGLIKSMVLGKLDGIDAKLTGIDSRVNHIDGRVISLEEWRKNVTEGSAQGRRAYDKCPAPGCPHEVIL